MFKEIKTHFLDNILVGKLKNCLARTVVLASFSMVLILGPVLGAIHGFKHNFGEISTKVSQNSAVFYDFGDENGDDSHSIFSCSACVFNGFSHNLIAVDSVLTVILAISLIFLGRAFDLSRISHITHSFSSREPPRR